MMNTLNHVKIRLLQKEDLETIIHIDEKILGENRKEYWVRKLNVLNTKSSQVSLVAEVEGEVKGFILGDVSGWEFGVPDSIGWIDSLGVDPLYQKRGLATFLIQELIKKLKAIGVRTIYTLVSWNHWDLLQFFHRMGFTRGDLINLELKI